VFVWSHSEFIEKNKLTIKSSYYYRAADAGDGIFTFSVPFTAGLYIPAFVITIISLVFTAMHLRRAVLATSEMSVCLSVCLSNA